GGCSCSPASTSGAPAAKRRTLRPAIEPPSFRLAKRGGAGSAPPLFAFGAAACAPMDDAMAENDRSLHVPIARGLACRCPRCGKGKLFTGFLSLRARCEVCGLDYSFVDSAD